MLFRIKGKEVTRDARVANMLITTVPSKKHERTILLLLGNTVYRTISIGIGRKVLEMVLSSRTA